MPKKEVRVNKPVFKLADPNNPTVLKLDGSTQPAQNRWSNMPDPVIDENVDNLPTELPQKKTSDMLEELGGGLERALKLKRWLELQKRREQE